MDGMGPARRPSAGSSATLRLEERQRIGDVVLNLDGRNVDGSKFRPEVHAVRVFNREFIDENVFHDRREHAPDSCVRSSERREAANDRCPETVTRAERTSRSMRRAPSWIALSGHSSSTALIALRPSRSFSGQEGEHRMITITGVITRVQPARCSTIPAQRRRPSHRQRSWKHARYIRRSRGNR